MKKIWIKDVAGEMSDCRFCLWWGGRSRGCERENGCFLRNEFSDAAIARKIREGSVCYGCPYGRVRPCIGWCMRNLLGEKGGVKM